LSVGRYESASLAVPRVRAYRWLPTAGEGTVGGDWLCALFHPEYCSIRGKNVSQKP